MEENVVGALDDAMAKMTREDGDRQQSANSEETWLRELCQEFVRKAVEHRVAPQELHVITGKQGFWGGTKYTSRPWRRGWILDYGDYDGGQSWILTTDGGFFVTHRITPSSTDTQSIGSSEPKAGSAFSARAHRLDEAMARFLMRGR